MAGNNYFQFKQFLIVQEKSAMKVGTDGVLLGAWLNPSGAKNILDIGTGTGLIALMLAQRTRAQITAVEIEKHAAEEAAFNVSRSPWEKRIAVENISFQDFNRHSPQKFDLIVSNPPFFNNAFKKQNINASIARHTDTLSYPDLLQGVKKLLNDGGRFAVIIPFDSSSLFIDVAGKSGLYPIRKTFVKPKPSKPANRCLIEFSESGREVPNTELTMHPEEGTGYTLEYKNLTRDFYLNF